MFPRGCGQPCPQQLFRIHRADKMLVPVFDDAHLMPADCLRKLRLLCEDFPRSHNLMLIGQPPAAPILEPVHQRGPPKLRGGSGVNESNPLPRHLLGPTLTPGSRSRRTIVLDQLDHAHLGHNTFTPEALALTFRPGGETETAQWPVGKAFRDEQTCRVVVWLCYSSCQYQEPTRLLKGDPSPFSLTFQTKKETEQNEQEANKWRSKNHYRIVNQRRFNNLDYSLIINVRHLERARPPHPDFPRSQQDQYEGQSQNSIENRPFDFADTRK